MSEAPEESAGIALEPVPCPLCDGTDHREERIIRGFRLVQCNGCGMVFVNPQPTAETLAAGYNVQDSQLADLIGGRQDKVDFYRTWFSERDQRRWQAVLRKLERIGGRGRLLEYGCGPAIVGQLAADAGWQVDAIDVGEWIRELQPERTFPLHVGTLDDMDWPECHFSVVYAQDVLEHLARPLDELRKLARLLRPGGVIYVHVPNYASLTIRLGVSRFAYNEPLGHLNYFTPRTLTLMLRKAGLGRVRLSSDHLEVEDFIRRGPFDYEAFERKVEEGGRRRRGRLWAIGRELINVPLGLFQCGTYLWGFAKRT